MLFFGMAAVAQQPDATIKTVQPQEYAKLLQEWQKIVDDVEKKSAVGPLSPDSINDMRERLKNIRTLAETRKVGTSDALKAQNDLLTALGPAPEEGSNIKEDKKVTE